MYVDMYILYICSVCCSNCGIVCIGHELCVFRKNMYIWCVCWRIWVKERLLGDRHVWIGVAYNMLCFWKLCKLCFHGHALIVCNVLRCDGFMYFDVCEFIYEFMYIFTLSQCQMPCSCQMLQCSRVVDFVAFDWPLGLLMKWVVCSLPCVCL